MLLTSFVPIKLIAKSNTQKQLTWNNPRVSSTRFCLPIRFKFIKENAETLQNESL